MLVRSGVTWDGLTVQHHYARTRNRKHAQTASTSADKGSSDPVAGGDDTEPAESDGSTAEKPRKPVDAPEQMSMIPSSAAFVKREGTADVDSSPTRDDKTGNLTATSSASAETRITHLQSPRTSPAATT